ncbi:MAG TPA: AAC(3) family N-acetyltransferase [Anaerolineae bacterium]|nr:AAC(3) family N-acetyltransferase [Anaerolineae bacterium]
MLTQLEIVRGLRDLGLHHGDAVEVHSSLSSLGWVEGGAGAVIEALIAVVGPEGAIVMSCYPVSPPLPLTEEDRARGIAWKVRWLPPDTTERTGIGIIADTFRGRPDVICGEGQHRVCAWGRDAAVHAAQVYAHLVAIDGWALLIGVDIYRCSSMHIAERVPVPQAITQRFALPDDIARDYPENEWGIGYGSTPGDPWMAVWREAERQGLIRHGQIGQADCALFRAGALVGIYEEMRRTDPYGLFGLEESGEDPDRETQKGVK